MISKLLEKDPDRRMTLEEVRVHPWVTDQGRRKIKAKAENCQLVLVTDEDVKSSITSIPKLHTIVDHCDVILIT